MISVLDTSHPVVLFRIHKLLQSVIGPGSSVAIATGPGSNPSWGEIFRTCPDRPWDPPSLLYNGYRVFPGGKERPGRNADLSPLLVRWSRTNRAIPLFPLRAVRPIQSLIACTGVHFTFTYTSTPPMGHTVFTEPQCLYKGALCLLLQSQHSINI